MNQPALQKVDERTLLVALCPLIAMSDTLVEALAVSVVLIAVALVTSAIVTSSSRWLDPELRLPAGFLTLTLIIGIVELVMLAWFPVLRTALGVFLPLMATNYALLRVMESSSSMTIARSMHIAALGAVALLILGVARELVGHGSLMHDAGENLGLWFEALEWTVFDLDMGFLLAMLPPGAFIALGLLIALNNAWHSRERVKE